MNTSLCVGNSVWLSTAQGCLYLCEECGETTEIKVWESRRDRASGKGMEGIKGGRQMVGVSKREEMRRSSGGVEGRASQVSTFLSIFHQAG